MPCNCLSEFARNAACASSPSARAVTTPETDRKTAMQANIRFLIRCVRHLPNDEEPPFICFPLKPAPPGDQKHPKEQPKLIYFHHGPQTPFPRPPRTKAHRPRHALHLHPLAEQAGTQPHPRPLGQLHTTNLHNQKFFRPV